MFRPTNFPPSDVSKKDLRHQRVMLCNVPMRPVFPNCAEHHVHTQASAHRKGERKRAGYVGRFVYVGELDSTHAHTAPAGAPNKLPACLHPTWLKAQARDIGLLALTPPGACCTISKPSLQSTQPRMPGMSRRKRRAARRQGRVCEQWMPQTLTAWSLSCMPCSSFSFSSSSCSIFERISIIDLTFCSAYISSSRT